MTSAKFEPMWRFMKENEKCQPDSNDISDDLMCTICKRVMINPHYGTCGCRYCLDCITAYLDGEQKWCLGDKEDCKEELVDINDNVYFDPVTNRIILKLPVKCPRQFCEFRCEWSKMEEHEKVCQIQPMKCPYVSVGCGETKLTQSMNEHLLVENESHTKLLLACIDGLYNEIGSLKKETATEREERQRVVEQQEREVERSNEAMRSMKAELEGEQRRGRVRDEIVDRMKEERKQLRRDNNSTTAKNKYIKTELEKSRELCRIYQNKKIELQMEQNKVKYQGDERRIIELEVQAQLEKEFLNAYANSHPIDEMLGICDDDEDAACEMIETLLQNQVFDSQIRGIRRFLVKEDEFIWRIDNCAANLQAAKSGTRDQIFSDAFFSHKNGYKVCLSLFPNGFGAGKGTHLGVFFHLMQGPFDNILMWPFDEIVIISIINQNTNTEYATYAVSFEESPHSDHWKKPQTERNGGLGKSKLIELEKLSRIPGLCKDDKIFIRCVTQAKDGIDSAK